MKVNIRSGGQLALFIVIETLLLWGYARHGEAYHWFLHFLTGGTATLLVLSLVSKFRQCPIRYLLMWLLAGHLFASFPDLLFALFHIDHAPWMDIFALHVSSHDIPAASFSLSAIFACSLMTYRYFSSARLR